MENYFAPIAEELCNFLVALSKMRSKKWSNPKAIKAFFDVGCDCYGKSTVVTYAEWLGEYDAIRGLI